jgi:hypothetical protein
MRRISLALALLGAVAAAGCGGAGGKSPAPSSGNKGVEDTTWKLVVRGEGAYIDPANGTTIILPKGGVVSGSGIDCGVDASDSLHKVCEVTLAYNTAVTLTATPNAPAYNVWGWAGACNGSDACSFAMTDTQFVGVRFAVNTAGLGAHPGFTDPAIHGQEFFKVVDADGVFLTTQTGLPATGYLCTDCHGGAALNGSGLAPSCASCHNWPISKGGHFDSAGAMAGHSGAGCGRCHNSDNFRDFTGADATFAEAEYAASVAFITGQSQALDGISKGTDLSRTPGQMHCNTCHNSTTDAHFGSWTDSKVFVRGVTLKLDGASAICAQCHDGARPQYNAAQVDYVLGLTSNAVGADQQLAASNATVRAHYLPAAATVYGEEAGNWYQYNNPAQNYTGRNAHGGKNSCTFCHDPHDGTLPADGTGALQVGGKCGACHFDETTGKPVTTMLQIEDQRQFGFEGDIDGNGTVEGLNVEIAGLQTKLYAAIQAYAKNVVGTQICNIIPAAGTTAPDNKFYVWDGSTPCATTMTAYNKYTPRLLKAAYNFLMSQNDFGSWAHNPRYAIEVLYDTIQDLNYGLYLNNPANVVAFAGKRSFNGHFGAADAVSPYAAFVYHGGMTGTAAPAAQGFTSAACYQCHGGQGGFAAYLGGAPAALANSVMTAANKVTGMQCGTCHTNTGPDMKGLRSIATVYFPPQKDPTVAANRVVSFAAADLPPTFALCGSCHSARENKGSIDALDPVALSTFSKALVNPHYLGAAATEMGTRAKSWYEYDGKSYTAYPAFWKAGTNGAAPGPHGSPHGGQCTGCHQGKASKHSFEVNFTYCNGCHVAPYALTPKEDEYASMKTELLAALNAYVTANLSAFQTGNGASATGLCYDGNVYGYVLVSTATGCTTTAAKLDMTSMRAAYNLHWMNKDPGGWAHNEYYVMQLVYDSITALGGTPSFTVTASSTDLTLNRP